MSNLQDRALKVIAGFQKLLFLLPLRVSGKQEGGIAEGDLQDDGRIVALGLRICGTEDSDLCTSEREFIACFWNGDGFPLLLQIFDKALKGFGGSGGDRAIGRSHLCIIQGTGQPSDVVGVCVRCNHDIKIGNLILLQPGIYIGGGLCLSAVNHHGLSAALQNSGVSLSDIQKGDGEKLLLLSGRRFRRLRDGCCMFCCLYRCDIRCGMA